MDLNRYKNLYEYLVADENKVLNESVMKRIYGHRQTSYDYKEDITQDIYLTLLEYQICKIPDDMLTQKYLDNLIFKIVSNYVYSKTSKCYRLYTRSAKLSYEYQPKRDVREDDINLDDDTMLSMVNDYIHQLSTYEQQLIDEYYNKGKSYRQIQSEYNIPLIAVWTDVTNAIDKIKRKFQEK